MSSSQTNQDLPSIDCSVYVSMGSTSTQGFYLNPDGQNQLLFFDTESPKVIGAPLLKKSESDVLNFMKYLMTKVQTNKKIVLGNSIGYAIDGGKKVGEEVGIPYSYVEDTDNFTDKSLVQLMANVIEKNPEMKSRFILVNRNCKTSDGEEVSGQWAKQIKYYLEEKGQIDLEWVLDLGGKSGTLYHLEQGIYVKKQTIFKEEPPNSFIKKPDEFIKRLDIELNTLVSAGFILKKMAIIQTGMFRDGKIKGIISDRVAYHKYIEQCDESKYEAVDFMKTVLKSEKASSFTLTPIKNKFEVTISPEKWFLTILFENLWYSVWG